jgi:hypothetical protein
MIPSAHPIFANIVNHHPKSVILKRSEGPPYLPLPLHLLQLLLLPLRLPVFRRHPERSEGPPHWLLLLHLPLHLLFCLSFRAQPRNLLSPVLALPNP